MPLVKNNSLARPVSKDELGMEKKYAHLPGNAHKHAFHLLFLGPRTTLSSRPMLTSDSLVRRNDDVVLLKISGRDIPVVTIVEIRRKVSRSNVVRDLFLPVR